MKRNHPRFGNLLEKVLYKPAWIGGFLPAEGDDTQKLEYMQRSDPE
jgi:hypothetical protein